MRNKTRQIVATIDTDEPGLDFKVSEERLITLTFPNAVYSYSGSGRTPFSKKLAPDEAREIGRELVAAADRITSAEHVA